MVKKKLSGQTIAIVILAILLVLAVIFGGVYAFYSSTTTKVTGRIRMANLSITVNDETPIFTTIGMSGSEIVPGQSLSNDKFSIYNHSNTDIYLIVAYSLNVVSLETEEEVSYPLNKPLLAGIADGWEDKLFVYDDGVHSVIKFRYLIYTQSIPETTSSILVFDEDDLQLNAQNVGCEFMSTSIEMAFQACAIGSNEQRVVDSLASATTDDERYDAIMSAIFQAFEYTLSIIE